jgi:hypothetical protein
MIAVGLYVLVNEYGNITSKYVSDFEARVIADGGIFEGYNQLYNELEQLGGVYGSADVYKKVELFDDEKISVTSSIQNVNDISKTFTDFSKTFTIPATKQNNKIFRHWYENSLDNGFSTLTKADAYIELDTIPFRIGKIQLESCNIKNNQPQDYSINFIGALGSLKDKFNGLFLKDLKSTTYDFLYSGDIVKNIVTTPAFNADIMFPLITSKRYWNYGAGGVNDISTIANPIRFNELFPAIRVKSVLNMIANEFGINFNGTTEEPSTFLTDERFTNAYLWLKNSEEFVYKSEPVQITWNQGSSIIVPRAIARGQYKKLEVTITPTVSGIDYTIFLYRNGIEFSRINASSIVGLQSFDFGRLSAANIDTLYTVYIFPNSLITFNSTAIIKTYEYTGILSSTVTWTKETNQTVSIAKLSVRQYFPEIKIEDFFSGILKMFNLTCYSNNGLDYTIRQLEEYYDNGDIVDITKHIKSDNFNLNRVKTYKKINFEYEKSDSLVNVGFSSANGIEYGSLFYNTGNDGEEYSIKLPFEDLNFSNLNDRLQVGYSLKSDLQKYIPKPVILYDYFPQGTVTTANQFYFSPLTTGNGVAYNDYKAFGQEYAEVDFPNIVATYSLNFNEQQSTLTNELINNSLYNQYYQNYLSNIFNFKARLIKVNAILPTSLLTTIKLNDRLVIRDKRYLINTMQTDLTTGEVQLELLTDFRIL